jgi:nicotinic acid phosphoribosyltransferase
MDRTLDLQPADYSLLTDLYQLTMGACYVGEGLDQRSASFELTARRLPDRFGYLIAMGLEKISSLALNKLPLCKRPEFFAPPRRRFGKP